MASVGSWEDASTTSDSSSEEESTLAADDDRDAKILPRGPAQGRLRWKQADPTTVCRRRSEIRGECVGLPGLFYRRMVRLRLPKCLFALLFLLARSRDGKSPHDLTMVEYFSGVQAITNEFRTQGFGAASFDIVNDSVSQNLLTDMGFLHAINLALRVKPLQGFTWWATVCSTWVWMCRNTTARSRKRPLGDVSLKCVRDANTMVSRMVALVLLCSARFVGYVIEQPTTSIMCCHPRMALLEALASQLPHIVSYHRVHTYMGAFAAPTPKPSVLYSCMDWVGKLSKQLPAGFVTKPGSETVKYDVVNGEVKVSGSPGLKKSQEYTTCFAKAVVAAYDGQARNIRYCASELLYTSAF